jgi:class 3 adenylate cyclase
VAAPDDQDASCGIYDERAGRWDRRDEVPVTACNAAKLALAVSAWLRRAAAGAVMKGGGHEGAHAGTDFAERRVAFVICPAILCRHVFRLPLMNSPLLQTWLRLADGRQRALTGTCSIGRHPTNTLPLASTEVSRRHAIVQAQDEGEFWLVDLGSANGTYLNGRRLMQATRLRHGDVIRIADVELEFATEILSAVNLSPSVSSTTRMAEKDCWLLIADIEDSTRLAQTMPPEIYPRITGAWFKDCRRIIEDCGGHMSKYLGDGFFCFWDTDADSLIGVRQAMARLREAQAASSLPFRVVLHHGSVVFGSVPTMSELNLHGPEVNFALSMKKVASGFGKPMLFSEAAVKKLAAETEVESAGQSSIEGFNGLFSFFASKEG